MLNKLLRGTLLLSSASFISKILGFIYIIPFTVLVGESGYTLYKYAYGPYTIMLSISTMGFPLAISKMISKYTQLEREDIIRTILKSGIILMFASGITSFLLLYFLSPFLAGLVVDQEGNGNSLESIIYVIRVVSIALIIVPPMSFLRGFFQGYQSMGPSAVSTVIEQLSRVIFILVGVFVSLEILDLSVTYAVGVGTFGAFIGGVFGLGVLLFYLWKRRKHIFKPVDLELNQNDISITRIYKEIIKYSIPFVIMGLSLPLYQNIDTYTINKVLMSIGYEQAEAETVNAVIGLAQILVLLPVSIITGLSVSIIPNITRSFIQQDKKMLIGQINQSFLLLMFIILPAAIGIFLLAEPLYLLIFGEGNSPQLGGQILKVYAPAAILIAFYGITSSILQAINEQKKLIIGLLIGVIIKLLLNIFLPSYFFENGFIIATYFGYFASLIFNIILIREKIGIRLSKIRYKLFSIFVSTFIMALIIFFIKNAFVKSNVVNDFLIVFICSVLGIVIYFLTIYGMNFNKFNKYLEEKTRSKFF